MGRPVRHLVLLAALALTLAACGTSGEDGTESNGGLATTDPTSVGEVLGENVGSVAIPPAAEPGDEELGEAIAAEASRRGREAKVYEDAAAVGALLNEFWSEELQALYGIEFDPPDRFEYYYGEEPTSCGGWPEPLPENAYYCPAAGDEHVAFDMDWFQRYLEASPGGPTTFLVLAHEWGHAVQHSWELAEPGIDVWQPPGQELDADCLAGVFLSRSIDAGTIVEEAGDAEAIFDWLYEAADSPWVVGPSHGTHEQRQAAFVDGVEQGTAYCRQIY
ncbi:MAG: hypothetical protein R2725_15630 [Solirubrobacterales bacterium]